MKVVFSEIAGQELEDAVVFYELEFSGGLALVVCLGLEISLCP